MAASYSHVKDTEGTPSKSLFRSKLSHCSPLRVKFPLCIQRKLWKSDSSQ